MLKHEGHMNLETHCVSPSSIVNDTHPWCHSLEQLLQGMNGLSEPDEFPSHSEHLISVPNGTKLSICVADGVNAGVGGGRGSDIVF